MRTISFFLMVLSFIVLISVLPTSVTVERILEHGLLNPTYKINLLPGRKIGLVCAFILSFVTAYFWIMVAWIETRLSARSARPGNEPREPFSDQPVSMKILKEAIRAGDSESLKEQLRAMDRLPQLGDEYFTPLELAELYGNEEIIAILTKWHASSEKPPRHA